VSYLRRVSIILTLALGLVLSPTLPAGAKLPPHHSHRTFNVWSAADASIGAWIWIAAWDKNARRAAFGLWVSAVPIPAPVPRPQIRRAIVVAPVLPTAPPPGNLTAVMQCIKDHESGNYLSNTYPPDGASGAYQYVGPTWRHWSSVAGYGGYYAAYQAPPSVQDAVTVYTLTHGGAGNWSPRWGDDPCTVGMGG
jgi:hypothetical protein